MIPKSTLGKGNGHNCFKIFDEYCRLPGRVVGNIQKIDRFCLRVAVVPQHETIPLILSTLYYDYFNLAGEKNISPDAAECFETSGGGGERSSYSQPNVLCDVRCLSKPPCYLNLNQCVRNRFVTMDK